MNSCLERSIYSSSYTELGIEAISDQNNESNESVLQSLFDGSDSFGNFLSNPYPHDGPEEKNSEKNSESKQFTTGDEFLPSQLLSDLLFGSTSESSAGTNKVSRLYSFS